MTRLFLVDHYETSFEKVCDQSHCTDLAEVTLFFEEKEGSEVMWKYYCVHHAKYRIGVLRENEWEWPWKITR